MNGLKAIVTNGFKRVGLWVLIASFVIGALFLYWFGFGLKSDESHRLETISIGNQIIRALEACHAENGQYPASLEQLVPKYLAAIKPPTWGQDGWQYTLHSPDSYEITVGYKDYSDSYYPVMIYSSMQSKDGWLYDN